MLLFICAELIASTLAPAAEPKPLCRFGVISTPYITAATKEELGNKRSFLLQTGPAGFTNALKALDELKPDFFVVVGDLTWTGSDQDFGLLKTYLDKIKVPVYLLPGVRDLPDGGERFLKHFGKKYGAKLRYSMEIHGIHLVFNSLSLEKPESQNELIDWLDKDLSGTKDSRATILVGNTYPLLNLRRPNEGEQVKRAWETVEKYRIAAVIVGGQSHTIDLFDGLPFWSAPTTGWSPQEHALGLVTVYEDHLDFSLYSPGQPFQVFTIPNPVKAKLFCNKPFVAPRLGNKTLYERVIFPEPRFKK